MQANDPKHPYKHYQGHNKSKEDKYIPRLIYWPVQSADLNPIELVWNELDEKDRAKKTHKLSSPLAILAWKQYIYIYIYTKILEATFLFVDFSKDFDSMHWAKILQILLAYGRPKETVTAAMMLYSNAKVKVYSQDGDRILRNCCWCSARRYISHISVHNLPDNVFRTSIDLTKENGFTKKKVRRYSAETIKDID